jgi:hypothetical protein
MIFITVLSPEEVPIYQQAINKNPGCNLAITGIPGKVIKEENWDPDKCLALVQIIKSKMNDKTLIIEEDIQPDITSFWKTLRKLKKKLGEFNQ